MSKSSVSTLPFNPFLWWTFSTDSWGSRDSQLARDGYEIFLYFQILTGVIFRTANESIFWRMEYKLGSSIFLESMNSVGVPSAGGVGGACCGCPGLSFISAQLISRPLARVCERVCIIDRPRPTASDSDLNLHKVLGHFRSYLLLSLFQLSICLSSSTWVSFYFHYRVAPAHHFSDAD